MLAWVDGGPEKLQTEFKSRHLLPKMDSVMAALGQKPSDRVQISSSAPEKSTENKISQQKPEDKPLSPEMEKLIEEMENQPQTNRLGTVLSFLSCQNRRRH